MSYPNLQKVSLLVASRNEAPYIKKCISSLMQQNYPNELLEVIIVDGFSTDGSYQIVQELIADRHNFQLFLNPKIIQSAAWNMGIDLCTGNVISIVSGHAIFEMDYVLQAMMTLQRTGADMVGGTVRPISDDLLGNAIALSISHPFGVGGARFRYTDKEEETDSVFMGFCHRSIYEKIGKFDEELVRNQDDEFSYRLRKAGGRIICNPNIVSFYHARTTYKSLWNQYYQYGFYKVRVLQKHPRQMSPRQFVPPLFVLSLLIFSIFAFLFPWGLSALSGLVILYALTNLITSLLVASREGWKYFFLLPLAFATLHLSYGTGFLMGLFRFWDRWKDPQGQVPEVKFD